jgi:hypothetical protein
MWTTAEQEGKSDRRDGGVVGGDLCRQAVNEHDTMLETRVSCKRLFCVINHERSGVVVQATRMTREKRCCAVMFND